MTAPFTEASARAALEEVYSAFARNDSAAGFAISMRMNGKKTMEEVVAAPWRINSGAFTTFAAWMTLFPCVDDSTHRAIVDEVGIADEGYKIMFWGRWSAKNKATDGKCTFPDGTTVDLSGREFKDIRYSYVVTFSRETKEALLTEVLIDFAELGRLMGSSLYAACTALQPIYPA